MPASKKLEDKHLDAAETVLNGITDKTKVEADPKEHLHIPSTNDKAHSWFRAVFPYDSLQDFESQWHLGNYVIDRQTGQKSFEPMSIYVRLGMHLLYYGSEQENVLQWRRAQEMLKDQSVKVGKQYDSPESRDHIQPFIESFQLQDTLSELVSLSIGNTSIRLRLHSIRETNYLLARCNLTLRNTATSTNSSLVRSRSPLGQSQNRTATPS
jgi:phosphatidylserine decarboxylase